MKAISPAMDAIKAWLENMNSMVLFAGALAALLYALFDHRDTCDEINAAKGWKRNALRLKLLVLWLVPAIGLIGWYASELASERADRTTGELGSNVVALKLKLKPRTITQTQVTNFMFLTEKVLKLPIKICIGMKGQEGFAVNIRNMFTRAGFPQDQSSGSGGLTWSPNSLLYRHLGETNEFRLFCSPHTGAPGALTEPTSH